VGYVEKLIDFKSNMMALAAKDTSLTSAPNLQGPPLTPNNIIVQEYSGNLPPNTIVHPPPNTSTPYSIVFHIENPMVVLVGDHHHDGC